MGPKWSVIASRLVGRTDNAVKNRFNGWISKSGLAEQNLNGEEESTLPESNDKGYALVPNELLAKRHTKLVEKLLNRQISRETGAELHL